MPNGIERVRQVALRDRGAKFTALLHHITTDLLREAYFEIKRTGAPGVDGVTWKSYRKALEENLEDLHGRIHRGAYKARPSRRAYIHKTDGGQRPLGIASLEDKIVQRAVTKVLNAIYEVEFLGFSYGFRPRRGAHDALDALAVAIERKKVNFVLDADIRGYFDAIDKGWLLKFIGHKIEDGRILRLIQKWLNAGVIEKEEWHRAMYGTPQGATISPLLANIYLHYAFDLWTDNWRRTRARGEVYVVRYADDFVVMFQYRDDAEQYQEALRQRLARFHLELHPDKTRLIEFGRFASRDRKRRGEKKPETFDFLGFTHICGKSRRGGFVLLRHTIKKRLRAKLHELRQKLREQRHWPTAQTGKWLGQVVAGWYRYHAIPTNYAALETFRRELTRAWHDALRRRSQRQRNLWPRTSRLAKRYLPRPRILHPWPGRRFDVKTVGRSPVR